MDKSHAGWWHWGFQESPVPDRRVGGWEIGFVVVRSVILAQTSGGAKNLTAWQIAREEAKPVGVASNSWLTAKDNLWLPEQANTLLTRMLTLKVLYVRLSQWNPWLTLNFNQSGQYASLSFQVQSTYLTWNSYRCESQICCRLKAAALATCTT